MQVLEPYHRILLLTEGQLGVFTSKTAAVVLKYRPSDAVALIDAPAAGRNLQELIPWAPPIPILPDVARARSLNPDALFIGIAPVGGALPPEMRAHVCDALAAGIDVVSGLHAFLADDAELVALADANHARIRDLRRPPADRAVASARALSTRCRRVLTVGTDCNVGKMVTALELAIAARRRGLDARFAATGQTGIMIAGRGICIDACVGDFVAGAAEQLVLDAAESDICFIEGQGSLGHPGYSGVTLALLHGTCPDALVLVHQVGRAQYKAPPHLGLPPIRDLIRAYEQTAGLLHPARVAAVALNSLGSPAEDARVAADRLEQELGLPVADPVRDGCDRLLSAPGVLG